MTIPPLPEGFQPYSPPDSGGLPPGFQPFDPNQQPDSSIGGAASAALGGAIHGYAVVGDAVDRAYNWGRQQLGLAPDTGEGNISDQQAIDYSKTLQPQGGVAKNDFITDLKNGDFGGAAHEAARAAVGIAPYAVPVIGQVAGAGDVASQRNLNNGGDGDHVSGTDLLIGGATQVPAMFAPGLGSGLAGRIASGALGGAIQGGSMYTGETLGTNVGFDPSQAASATLGGALIGGLGSAAHAGLSTAADNGAFEYAGQKAGQFLPEVIAHHLGLGPVAQGIATAAAFTGRQNPLHFLGDAGAYVGSKIDGLLSSGDVTPAKLADVGIAPEPPQQGPAVSSGGSPAPQAAAAPAASPQVPAEITPIPQASPAAAPSNQPAPNFQSVAPQGAAERPTVAPANGIPQAPVSEAPAAVLGQTNGPAAQPVGLPNEGTSEAIGLPPQAAQRPATQPQEPLARASVPAGNTTLTPMAAAGAERPAPGLAQLGSAGPQLGDNGSIRTPAHSFIDNGRGNSTSDIHAAADLAADAGLISRSTADALKSGTLSIDATNPVDRGVVNHIQDILGSRSRPQAEQAAATSQENGRPPIRDQARWDAARQDDINAAETNAKQAMADNPGPVGKETAAAVRSYQREKTATGKRAIKAAHLSKHPGHARYFSGLRRGIRKNHGGH